jgi:hypothetical protein
MEHVATPLKRTNIGRLAHQQLFCHKDALLEALHKWHMSQYTCVRNSTMVQAYCHHAMKQLLCDAQAA